MNRVALHHSTVRPMSPVQLVEVARRSGFDSIGLRVAAAPEGDEWWRGGIGSPMLPALVDALLDSRVTVLDIGRIELGPELRSIDVAQPYLRVLGLGPRLGAQFVTARAGSADEAGAAGELFAVLAELARRSQLRALLTVVPGTAVDTLERAVEIVGPTRGGIVLDVDPAADPDEVATRVVELGDLLGYVRLPATSLETGAEDAAGLLSTLPPQIPVAVGTDEPGCLDRDHVARATALRGQVETLLRHPRARAR